MSYDIRFGVKVADINEYAVIGTPEYDHPSYNIGKVLRLSTKWDFDQGAWYKVDEVLYNIERGIQELQFKPKKYSKDGDVASALETLESIMKYLNEDLKWSWNCNIPLSSLYIMF